MKKLFVVLFALMSLGISTFAAVLGDGDPIPLTCERIKYGTGVGQTPRDPLPSLTIGQDDHTLYMSNVGFDCVLRIIDDDDNVVYSTYVAASTNTVVLPSTLSGSYRIELVTDDWLFWGYILL